jgi:hypothetical protein
VGLLWRLFAPKPLKKARRSVRKAALKTEDAVVRPSVAVAPGTASSATIGWGQRQTPDREIQARNEWSRRAASLDGRLYARVARGAMAPVTRHPIPGIPS